MLGTLLDMMQRWNVDIMRVQNTKWDGSEASCLAAWFKQFCCGINGKRNETISHLEGGVFKKCVESEMCITECNEFGAKN